MCEIGKPLSHIMAQMGLTFENTETGTGDHWGLSACTAQDRAGRVSVNLSSQEAATCAS